MMYLIAAAAGWLAGIGPAALLVRAERQSAARLLSALAFTHGEVRAAEAISPKPATPKEVPGLQVRAIGLHQR